MLAFVFVKLQEESLTVGMICFGVQCFLLGLWIIKSKYLPKLTGIVLAICGLGYFITLLAQIAWPPIFCSQQNTEGHRESAEGRSNQERMNCVIFEATDPVRLRQAQKLKTVVIYNIPSNSDLSALMRDGGLPTNPALASRRANSDMLRRGANSGLICAPTNSGSLRATLILK